MPSDQEGAKAMERVRASPGGSLSHSMQEINSAEKHRIDASGASPHGVSSSLDVGSGLLRRAPDRCSDDAEVIHYKNF